MLPGVCLTVTILGQRGPWRRTKCRVVLENVISRTKFQKVGGGEYRVAKQTFFILIVLNVRHITSFDLG